MKMIFNYHTHTERCRHATGAVRDYCLAACSAGLLKIGFSDHVPLPDLRWGSVRMTPAELPLYLEEIKKAQLEFKNLQIFSGFECDYAPEYLKYYKDLLDTRSLDYLIGAVHWFPYEGQWVCVYDEIETPAQLRAYADHYVCAIQSGLFKFMAHPDVFGNCWLKWDQTAMECAKKICFAAQENKIPLEINGYGFLKPPVEALEGVRPMYPLRAFWEIASNYTVNAVINSDAHRPQDITSGFSQAIHLAESCGIRVVDPFAENH